MTDLHKSNDENTDINFDDDINTDTSIAAKQALNTANSNVHSQQVSIKAWSQKLLVVLLCLAAFMVAGNLMSPIWSMNVRPMAGK